MAKKFKKRPGGEVGKQFHNVKRDIRRAHTRIDEFSSRVNFVVNELIKACGPEVEAKFYAALGTTPPKPEAQPEATNTEPSTTEQGVEHVEAEQA
jgi:hypothetical protein